NTVEEEEEAPLVDPRPTGQIVFDKGHCICKAGKQTILNDCSAFCVDKTHEQEYLYADFILGATVASRFPSLYNWCSDTIEGDGTDGNTACELQFVGNNGHTGAITTIEYLDQDSIRVEVGSQLQEDVVYILTLAESSSSAKTNSVQVQKGDIEDEDNFQGMLWMNPVNQYTCMSLALSSDQNTGETYVQAAFPLHYYYLNSDTPPTIPPGISNIYCHDIQADGAIQDPEDNRLELIPNHFATWNQGDPRFHDLNQNGNLDIHDKIQEIVTAKGVTFDAATNQIFVKFSWPNYPYNAVPSAPGGASAESAMGYIMTPWIDQVTFRAYCPVQTHYLSDNEIFKVLKEYVGVDTEGLYLAVKEPEITFDDSGNQTLAADDYILIKESQLKQVWFYIENSLKIEPTNENVGNHTVHFYWPADPTSPYIKKPNQKLYTIRHPSQITTSPGNSTDIPTTFTPHDKRFACVPKLSE
ncbi:hypothetical protein N9B72_01820, partial [Bacteriovoracaceae bacterium]|nr:hypothetical protein [Bacteriovoracaceae bacterium]